MSFEQTTKFREDLWDSVSCLMGDDIKAHNTICAYFHSMGWRLAQDGVEEDIYWKVCEDVEEYYGDFCGPMDCFNIRRAIEVIYGINF